MKKKAHSANAAMYRRFDSCAEDFARLVYLTVGSEFSLTLLKQSVRHSTADLMELVSASVDPSTYVDIDAFRADYLCAELMSKFPEWEVGVNRKQAALDVFLESEKRCLATNARLSSPLGGSLHSDVTPLSVFDLAARKIRRLLGPFNWDHAALHFGHGPGATYDLGHRYGDAYYKYKKKPCTTRACAGLAYAAIAAVPTWFCHVSGVSRESFNETELWSLDRSWLNIVEGNRITTVPKNAKTDRVIAIEPTMNAYVQKGIGGVIRSRLKRVGVDLDDQTRNQQLAQKGSVDGSLATLDLKSASDSVSTKLVEVLLPTDWVTALFQCRSSSGVLPSGEVVEYQKVSSMGNGYTFELESLIFWALSSAVTDLLKLDGSSVSVFGDDIIVPSAAAHTVKWILAFAGFEVNEKKSHSTGFFRESCGKHYLHGSDVSPIYVRKDITSIDRLFWLCNQIRRWSRLPYGLDARYEKVYTWARDLLPGRYQKPTIPDGYGDFALFGDFDEAAPRCFSSGEQLFEGVCHVPVREATQFEDLPYLLRQLTTVRGEPTYAKLGAGRRLSSEGLRVLAVATKREKFFTRGSGVPSQKRVKWVSVTIPVNRWESYGPWL